MKHILLLGLCCVAMTLAACGDKKGADGPSCTVTGEACTADADCCTNHCETLTGMCSRVAGECLMSGDACGAGPDCCSFSCVDFKCSGTQCTGDGQSCGADGECCGGVCSNGTCAPLNASCKTSGNSCAGNGECCSGFCKDGLCNNAGSFCTQTGDTCSGDAECCGGICTKSGTATLGTCTLVPSTGATGCLTTGEFCGAGADYNGTDPLPMCGGECCSRACFPYGPNGILICQPPSGCRPTGELCTKSEDCCGGPGQPDSESNVMCRIEPGFSVGRCDNGNSCSPAGAICRLQSGECNANANCCAGNVLNYDTCKQDNLGIPRCGITGCATNDPNCTDGCTDPQSKVGQVCASSADCCGLPCTGSPEAGFFCQAGCQNTSQGCTTDADCCSGLPCVFEGGSTTGLCGMTQGCSGYGQGCDATHLCCEGLTCAADGTCQGNIIL
jgi:hypothetical protein